MVEPPLEPPVDERTFEPIARMVLACVGREYPSHLSHTLAGDADARPPRELTPAFHGSYDWHSAVHGHWCLARLLRLFPRASFAAGAEAALARSLTVRNLAAEAAYAGAPGREGFERPYGLAWLLQLAAELREWGRGPAPPWLVALRPLEALAAERLRGWLPRLRWPVRTGEHGQTAFALGLALDWARSAGERGFAALIREHALAFYGRDEDAPLAYEPSGQDFLSPTLGEGVAAPLPADAARARTLNAAAWRHREAGLAALPGEHYAGRHWLGSFATYLLTGRGFPS